MITIEEYLENVLKDFCKYLDSEPRLCDLKNVNFNAGTIPDYTDIHVQQLYLLRYVYAYAFEYKSMYESLLQRQRYKDNISVVSIGCGTMVDYWSLVEALKERGIRDCTVKYRGIDSVDWNYKFKPRSKDDVRFIESDAIKVFEQAKQLSSDVCIFPKSISEFTHEDFETLCAGFGDKEIEKDIFYILISLRSDEYSMERDISRTKKLIDAIQDNGYSTSDKYNSYIHYKDQTKGIITYDSQFIYPNSAIDTIKRLNEYCKQYLLLGENCYDECEKYLTRWPILKPTTIRFQILKFERND